MLGSFVNAQLFSKSTGGYTLVVVRPDGAFDRYDLSGEAAEGLRAVVATALASGAGAGVGEQTTVASDPAGNAFVRNQAFLGLVLYGPAASAVVGSTTHSVSAPLAVELITASGAFAAALARRNMLPPVTTAQNRLSTHAALHGAAIANAITYAAGGDLGDGRTGGGATLAGSVGGTLLGLHFARNMTDAEAAASGFGADFAAAASLGVLGAAGALQRESSGRPAAVIASAAMLAGYALGPAYPRRARYTVTDGDVRAMTLTSMIGIAGAAIPFIEHGRSGSRAVSATLTAGMVAGALAGDRMLVRPRDHTSSESTLLWTGAGVGAFLGGGVAALGDASAQPAWALAVGGALLGTVATEAAIRPRAAGRRVLSDRSETQSAELREPAARRTQITFDPVGAVFAATSKVGTFSVLRVSF
ncbi:MAG TPA: hypothetical protein VFN44_10020 [Solirubrobacteraceae bacterium]|nr:hypothetical protein [Solirubrobacteraceae bacterium]